MVGVPAAAFPRPGDLGAIDAGLHGAVSALRPSRHELPEIDAAALEAARAADQLLAAARELSDRWEAYFEAIPGRLRDDTLPELKATVRRARAAYGPKDSVRDLFPEELTEPLLDRLDRLNKAINRWENNRG